MKLFQVKSINEATNPNLVMGMNLVFKHSICPLTGERRSPGRQPDGWGHVRRLTNMLFLAWDDDHPHEGTVYLGEFESSVEAPEIDQSTP